MEIQAILVGGTFAALWREVIIQVQGGIDSCIPRISGKFLPHYQCLIPKDVNVHSNHRENPPPNLVPSINL
jgi:hypothetical protein